MKNTTKIIRVGSGELVRCFHHYCPMCGAEHYIRAGNPEAEYPRCCGKHMRFLGHADAVPGRDEQNMKTANPKLTVPKDTV